MTTSALGTYRRELSRAVETLDLDAIMAAAELIYGVWERRRTVYTAGNGGSASTASHLVCDLRKLTAVTTKPRLHALSLCDNVALITAISNDISYEDVFVEQATGGVGSGDVVVCISGSGNSENIVRLARYCKESSARTIGLIGFQGGELRRHVDVSVIVSSNNMQVIEDVHLSVGHMLATVIRDRIQHSGK